MHHLTQKRKKSDWSVLGNEVAAQNAGKQFKSFTIDFNEKDWAGSTLIFQASNCCAPLLTKSS